jgi:hypothetical protein
MPKKERQRRKSRQERAPKAQEESSRTSSEKASRGSKANITQAAPKHHGKAAQKGTSTGTLGRIRNYLSGVKTEMHRVVWPSKAELKDYSVATIFALIACGFAIWLVDTGFVALLVRFTGLRG